MDVSVRLLYLCCPVCRQRPCDELIPRSGSLTSGQGPRKGCRAIIGYNGRCGRFWRAGTHGAVHCVTGCSLCCQSAVKNNRGAHFGSRKPQCVYFCVPSLLGNNRRARFCRHDHLCLCSMFTSQLIDMAAFYTSRFSHNTIFWNATLRSFGGTYYFRVGAEE
jgi:hypothetical protein